MNPEEVAKKLAAYRNAFKNIGFPTNMVDGFLQEIMRHPEFYFGETPLSQRIEKPQINPQEKPS